MFNTPIVNLGAALLFAIFVLVPLFAVQKIGTWLYLIVLFIGAVIARQLFIRGRLRLGSMLIILLA